MKKSANLFIAFVIALLLNACSGGGGGGTDVGSIGASSPSSNVPTPAVAPVTNVSFINVPTATGLQKVAQGQSHVELAAFGMQWPDPVRPSISQLVFTSESANLWATYKDITLMDNNGNDIKNESPYDMQRDEANRQVIVNFYSYPWYPNDYGPTPKSYSLVGSLNPGVPVGVTSVFKLTAVQLHEASKTPSFDVKGVRFEVVQVKGVSLPMITATSSANLTVSKDSVGHVMAVGSYSASCPTESQMSCYLESIAYTASGMSEPALGVDGSFFPSSHSTSPNEYYTYYASVGIALAPGQSKVFTVWATPQQLDLLIAIPKMVWVVGGVIRVNPIIPSDPTSCGLMVSDSTGCKG